MKTLDEKFVEFIKQSKNEIETKICRMIDNEGLCPCDEGVSCHECLKYALDIMTKV